MNKYIFVIMTLFSVYAMGSESENKYAKLAEDFGYATQASMQCDDLNMRLDTSGKVMAILGEDVSERTSKYNENYSEGLINAVNDKNVCSVAWEKFGCSGTETAKLLQQNPFTHKNGVMCKFN